MSRPFRSFIETLKSDIENYCEFIDLVADNDEDVIRHFNYLQQTVDCIVFSGQAYYQVLINTIGTPSLPCYALDERRGDIKEIFLNLLLSDRHFNFSRVFVDFAIPENEYLGIKKLLPEDQWPVFNSSLSESIPIFVKNTYARHIELHQSGQIDLSITRFGTMCHKLDEMGYNNIYIYPPKEYFFNFIMQIVTTFQQKINQNQMPTCIKINFTSTEEMQIQEVIEKIQRFFKKLSKIKGYDFVFQIHESQLDILTYYVHLDSMTSSLTSSRLFNELISQCPEINNIGLGTGYNVFSARENATKAILYAINSPNDIYYVNQNNLMNGPLGSKDTVAINGRPNNQLLAISESFGINHINLQKIIALTELTNSTLITSRQLADYLGVTMRSANRLLKQISDKGGAISHTVKVNEGRGRPSKYYDLVFTKDL